LIPLPGALIENGLTLDPIDPISFIPTPPGECALPGHNKFTN